MQRWQMQNSFPGPNSYQDFWETGPILGSNFHQCSFSFPKEVIMDTREFYPLNYPWQQWGTICGFGRQKKLIFLLHK